MNLIDSNDILKASKLNRFGGNLGGSLVAKLVMYIMRLNKINKLYLDNGYFTCRAILPAQTIKNGTVKIEILDFSVRRLRNKEVPLVKVF